MGFDDFQSLWGGETGSAMRQSLGKLLGLMSTCGIPLHRRLQTLAVVFWIGLLWICLILSVTLLLNPFTSFLFLLYIGWIWFWDRRALYDYQRKAPNLSQRFPFPFRYFCDFFPMKLVNDGELDPRDVHIFAYHPYALTWINCVGMGFSVLVLLELSLSMEQNFLECFQRLTCAC